MKIKLELPKKAITILDKLKQIHQLHSEFGLRGEQFNHTGKYGELIACAHFDAIKRPKKSKLSSAVDIVLPDGRTVQVKTTGWNRPDITCTYDGNEDVDLLLVLEINKSCTEVYVLFMGPFGEFINTVNSDPLVIKRRQIKDGHRFIPKSLVMELQKKIGISVSNFPKHNADDFFCFMN